jgi:hypothetical protein
MPVKVIRVNNLKKVINHLSNKSKMYNNKNTVNRNNVNKNSLNKNKTRKNKRNNKNINNINNKKISNNVNNLSSMTRLKNVLKVLNNITENKLKKRTKSIDLANMVRKINETKTKTIKRNNHREKKYTRIIELKNINGIKSRKGRNVYEDSNYPFRFIRNINNNKVSEYLEPKN